MEQLWCRRVYQREVSNLNVAPLSLKRFLQPAYMVQGKGLGIVWTEVLGASKGSPSGHSLLIRMLEPISKANDTASIFMSIGTVES